MAAPIVAVNMAAIKTTKAVSAVITFLSLTSHFAGENCYRPYEDMGCSSLGFNAKSESTLKFGRIYICSLYSPARNLFQPDQRRMRFDSDGAASAGWARTTAAAMLMVTNNVATNDKKSIFFSSTILCNVLENAT